MSATGRHFLQIPGPTNVPERVLLAMARSTIDHRGPEFAEMGFEVLEGIKRVARTSGPVVIFPSSGTGAAEASLVNVLSPGDRILIFETGWFSHIAWRVVAERLGLAVDYVPGAWRTGASPDILEQRLRDDAGHGIKAVVVVHNETSTGVVSRIGDLRRAMNRTGHPALLIVDAISSLGSIEYRHEDWEVDVMVCGVAERPDGAARARLQCGFREGPAREQGRPDAEVLLGLAGDAQGQRFGILPIHPGNQSPVWVAGSAPDAAGRGSRQRVAPARAPRSRCQSRSTRVGLGTRS